MAKATGRKMPTKRATWSIPHDDMTDEILDALEERRQSLGITLESLANESGSAYPYVQQLLRGRSAEKTRHSPTLDKLAPIARALGMRLKLVRDR